jgi:phage terminase large subunit GpA-like protein
MSWAHRLVRLLPRRWADALEADSRRWLIVCPSCGHERSVWDIGGIRYKAAGNPRWYMRCPQCGQRSWHKVVKRDAA